MTSVGLQAEVGAGQPDLGEPGPKRRLTGDERRAAGGAALLGVIIGEDDAFLGDPVDIRRAVAHQALGVDRDVPLADVVAEDHEDVRLRRRGRILRRRHPGPNRQNDRRAQCPQHRNSLPGQACAAIVAPWEQPSRAGSTPPSRCVSCRSPRPAPIWRGFAPPRRPGFGRW